VAAAGDLEPSLQKRAVVDADRRRRQVAGYRRGFVDDDPGIREQIAIHRAADDDGVGDDVGRDIPGVGHDDRVSGDVDRAADMTGDGQWFVGEDLPGDANRRSDLCDVHGTLAAQQGKPYSCSVCVKPLENGCGRHPPTCN